MQKTKLFKVKATQLLEVPKNSSIVKSPIGHSTICIDGHLYQPEVRWVKFVGFTERGGESWESVELESSVIEPTESSMAVELGYNIKQVKK